MNLEPVTTDHAKVLFNLLKERTPEQSISHKEMPSWEGHVMFVSEHPYSAWYMIMLAEGVAAGSIYLTKQREVGIFLFESYHGVGYAAEALSMLMDKHPGPILANINPQNYASLKFFNRCGFKHIQETFRHDGKKEIDAFKWAES